MCSESVSDIYIYIYIYIYIKKRKGMHEVWQYQSPFHVARLFPSHSDSAVATETWGHGTCRPSAWLLVLMVLMVLTVLTVLPCHEWFGFAEPLPAVDPVNVTSSNRLCARGREVGFRFGRRDRRLGTFLKNAVASPAKALQVFLIKRITNV